MRGEQWLSFTSTLSRLLTLVSHNNLSRLGCYGLSGCTSLLAKRQLHNQIQRLTVNQIYCNFRPVARPVWQTDLGPVTFNSFSNDLEESIIKLAWQPIWPVNTLGSTRNLHRLKKQAKKNLMKFSKDKYQVLLLRRAPCSDTGWRAALLNLGVLVDGKLCISRQYALAARKDCVNRSTAGRLGEEISPFSSALAVLHPVLGPPIEEKNQ